MNSNDKPCVFEALEPRFLMSGTSVAAELFATAVPLNVAPAGSVSVDSSIAAFGQRQMYQFTTQARGKFTIQMNANASDINSYLQVFNASGKQIKRNDNLGRGTLDSRVLMGTKPGQTFYVMASGAQETYGDYTLSVTSTPRDDFGNSAATGKLGRLNKGKGYGRFGGMVNYAGDVDAFRFVATKSGLMQINQIALGKGSSLGGNFEAYDSGDNLLGASDGANGATSFDVVAGQSYYLKMTGLEGSQGKYRINIQPTLSYLFINAQELSLPSLGEVATSGNRVEATASHGYKFTAGATGTVYIDMESDGSEIDPFLRVYNAKTKLVARNDNASRLTTDSRIRLRVKAGQTYYVEADAAGNSSGAYNLTLTSVPKDDIGNDFAAAKWFRLNKRGAARRGGIVNYGEDSDMMSFVATKTGTMTVASQAIGRNNSLSRGVWAYNSEGESLGQDAGGTSLSFYVVSGQRYYMKVTSSDSSTGRYQVNLSTNTQIVPPAPPDDTPIADNVITTEVVSWANGLQQLLVKGTDEFDTITVSQSNNYMTVTTPGQSYNFDGNFASVVVYGFDGDDVIRLDDTVSTTAWIYGDAGDDTLFEAGAGAATLYGGAGDDMLVSVGGNGDKLYGGGDFDSFWVDGADTVSDASTSETLANSVHQIAKFYQPYATSPGSASYVSMEIAGQDLIDPALTSYATGYENFASSPLFVGDAQYDDVSQGAVGDCYLLASMASLTQSDPGLLEQTVASLGDGTYAVRFYRDGKEVYLRVDADLPVRGYNSLAYAKLGSDGELWVPIIEKAYTYFRRGENSYQSISGGWMGTVNRELTNKSSWSGSVSSYSAEGLYNSFESLLNGSQAVTLGSYSGISGPIVGNHAYMVKSVETVDEQMMVTVYNPWGVDGRVWDNNYVDGLLTISMDQVQENFFAIAVSTA